MSLILIHRYCQMFKYGFQASLQPFLYIIREMRNFTTYLKNGPVTRFESFRGGFPQQAQGQEVLGGCPDVQIDDILADVVEESFRSLHRVLEEKRKPPFLLVAGSQYKI